MATHTFTVASSLSNVEAFDRMVDLERVTEWDEGILSSERIGQPGPVLGSRFDVGVNGFDGQPTSVVYEITEADAPSRFVPGRFVMVGENAAFRAVDEVTMSPSDTGCVVTYVAGLELLGDNPPLTETQLDSLFAKIVAVPEAGLARFLNPPPG